MAPEAKHPRLAITGIGMVTPIGLEAHEAYASFRTGVSLMQELAYYRYENDWFEEQGLVGCPITGVTDGTLGLGRWTRLASDAIRDLLGKSGLDTKALNQAGVFIALPPAARPGMDERIAHDLGKRLGEWLEDPGLARRTQLFPEGNAALMHAVSTAGKALERGVIPWAIVGGVDSLIEPETLESFMQRKRLKTEDHPDGFIPGEAAAFFLLEMPDKARARGAKPLAWIDAVGVALEPATIEGTEPPQAEGLSEAIRTVLDALPERGADIGLVVCDLNGESYRSKEYGVAAPRVLKHLKKWELWHAADCMGETGAASAAVSVCLAARAFEKKEAPSLRTLVFSGSDEGLRGALSLSGKA